MRLTKTRLAPTPSGFLHLGNVMSFLITTSLAKHYGAKILLRIDDIDRERVKRRYVEDIFHTLEYLEIPWDEGPKNYQDYKDKYSQVHRLQHYQKALDKLKSRKKLFACDCSRRKISLNSPDEGYTGTCEKKHLPLENNGLNWRLYTTVKEIAVNDLARPNYVMSIPPLLRDFVIRKKDSMPAYQLTSVVDDMLDKVDFIVRGKDLMGSTVAQLYLSAQLPANPLKKTTFLHHRLMVDSHNRKMSKSSGATSIQHLIKSGTDKAGIYAIIADFLKLDVHIASFTDFQSAYIADLKSKENSFL
ncbi:MAG TPA: glutamate--tRNA ligase family protein [Cyclobacteriaceae bacterium]|nr:glutamate--tRNA ligase family protein [Cyclobacteriaceae bacterium]